MDRKAVVKELVKDQLDPAYIFLPLKSRTLSPPPEKTENRDATKVEAFYIRRKRGKSFMFWREFLFFPSFTE